MGYDDDVHTPSTPYCSNLSCWCHTSVEYHEEVTEPLNSSDIDLGALYSFTGWDVPPQVNNA